MDRRRKPIVINVGHGLKRETNASYISRNNTQNKVVSSEKSPALKGRDKIINELLTPELDVELKNDFKWLINFNLKKILGRSIDEESKRKQSLKKKKKVPRSKENSHKQDYKFPLMDIIEQCLIERDGVTVREIFKWISARYPYFKSKDWKWKNFVRKILTKNPLFKNKKPKCGRSDTWHLDKGDSKESSNQNEQRTMEDNIFKTMNSKELGISKETTAELPKFTKSYPFSENFSSRLAVDDVQTNIVRLYSSENWIETAAGFHSKDSPEAVKQEVPFDYYEMQTPLASEIFLAENVEPLEVASFLNENTNSITLELI